MPPQGPDEGEGEGEEAPVLAQPIQQPSDKYEIVGTLTTPYQKGSEDILFTIKDSDDHFREEILKCGYIIYDITKHKDEIAKALKTLGMIVEEFEKIREIGEKAFERFNENKVFILISTVMTWGLTKPLDPVRFYLDLARISIFLLGRS